ncbi:hypothetical protein SAY87_010606 [Trapa incisa]|uniref:Expansin-like CBD domain-containing protein n=1 Tax=Trapa incisa TaxID=236973 RepID=A0AAN7JHR1_9MYRT|nr:hypothetical protein SAY87_010606 [Trapa incisa]
MVLISNVGGGGDLKAVSVRGSMARTWAAINRNWGANWQSSIDLQGQGLSFRLNLVDGRTMDFFMLSRLRGPSARPTHRLGSSHDRGRGRNKKEHLDYCFLL